MKDQQSVSVGANAVVRIKVQGDLRVQSHEAAEVMAASDESFSVTAEGNQGALVDADGDVNVRVPADAKIVIENVGGSARVRDIGAAVEIGGVGGDLSLKQLASVTVGGVGGDVHASEVDGTCSITGAGGDIILGVKFQAGHDYAFRAGGDIICNVVEGSSATASTLCGGELTTRARSARVANGSGSRANANVIIGEGAATVSMHAGGDIVIRDQDASAPNMESLASSIEALVSRQLSGSAEQVSAALERSGIHIQRALEHAQRKVEEVERRTEQAGRRSRRWGVVATPQPPRAPEPAAPPTPHEPVSNDERMTILRLVETGKISAAEAAQLLSALEGK